MKYDVVFTPEAAQCWKEAIEAIPAGRAPGLSLAVAIIRADGASLGIRGIGCIESSSLAVGTLTSTGSLLEEVAQLAWSVAFPRPIGLPDLWHSLFCLDINTRCELTQIIGQPLVNEMHRTAACAVLGEAVVIALEKGLRRPS